MGWLGGIVFFVRHGDSMRRRFLFFRDPLTINCGEPGGGECIELFAAMLAVEIIFDILQAAAERAFGGRFVAGKIGIELLVFVGPSPGVARQIRLDLFETAAIAFEKPMRERGFVDQQTGELIIAGLVVIEPSLNCEFKFFGIFATNDGLLRAAAVREAIQGGARFSGLRTRARAAAGLL